MNIDKLLQEEWKDSISYKHPITYGKKKQEKETVEVFVNPIQKEMNKVSKVYNQRKYIRFIAHEGKVYVFTPTAFHDIIADKLGIKESEKIGYWGTAVKRNNEWILDGSDIHGNRSLPKYAKKWINDQSGDVGHTVLPYQFRNQVTEEWKDSFKSYGGRTADVFVNPTKIDLAELTKDNHSYIRWVADIKGKKIYMWRGELGIHEPVFT